MEANTLQAKDLRIGNYLQNKNISTFIQVGRISQDNTIKIDFGMLKNIFSDTMNLSAFDPIPISEDILLKLGFNTEMKQVVSFADYGHNPVTKDFIIELKNVGKGWFYRNGHFKIDFVHQLQNLYFSLCGEELTIKE